VDGHGTLYITDPDNFRVRKVAAPMSLSGQLVVTATYSLTGDPVANTPVRFTLGGNPDARFPNNTTSADVMTNDHGIATAPLLMAEGNASTVTIHVTEPDNHNNNPTTHHAEASH
jgi:hypothetical protein